MSVATAMNLAIALVEERTRAARLMMRTAPIEDARHMSNALGRFEGALNNRIRRELYLELEGILRKSMQAEPPEGLADNEPYRKGVVSVEDLIDARMEELRRELKWDNDDESLVDRETAGI